MNSSVFCRPRSLMSITPMGLSLVVRSLLLHAADGMGERARLPGCVSSVRSVHLHTAPAADQPDNSSRSPYFATPSRGAHGTGLLSSNSTASRQHEPIGRYRKVPARLTPTSARSTTTQHSYRQQHTKSLTPPMQRNRNRRRRPIAAPVTLGSRSARLARYSQHAGASRSSSYRPSTPVACAFVSLAARVGRFLPREGTSYASAR